jgi:hypothetical protein
MAIITIQRSNLARSIANSMSWAKKIEREGIRFIMHVQIQEIRHTRNQNSLRHLYLSLIAAIHRRGSGKAERALIARSVGLAPG